MQKMMVGSFYYMLRFSPQIIYHFKSLLYIMIKCLSFMIGPNSGAFHSVIGPHKLLVMKTEYLEFFTEKSQVLQA